MTLADFLLARIAEDEAVAKAAPCDNAGWFVDPSPGHDGEWLVDSNPSLICYGNSNRDTQEHIARHDPARVLAECEAKRRIVKWHKNWPVLVETRPEQSRMDGTVDTVPYRMTKQIAWATEQQYRERFGSEPPTGPILRFLALPYADHPDFRDEWRIT